MKNKVYALLFLAVSLFPVAIFMFQPQLRTQNELTLGFDIESQSSSVASDKLPSAPSFKNEKLNEFASIQSHNQIGLESVQNNSQIVVSKRYLINNPGADSKSIKISKKAQNARILPRFEASSEVKKDYYERAQVSVDNNMNFVLDQYYVLLKESNFPLSIDRVDSFGIQLVTTDGESLREIVSSLVETYEGELLYTYENVLPGFSASFSSSEIDKLKSNPWVSSVIPDYFFESTSIGDGLWGLDRVDQVDGNLDGSFLSDNSLDGSGVHVYVMDSGIDALHPEFDGRIGSGFFSCVDEYIDPDDDNNSGLVECVSTDDKTGHGTHVAGIIGGESVGVANGVTLHPVRILNAGNRARGGWGTVSDFEAALEFVMGDVESFGWPAVINASLSFNGLPASQALPIGQSVDAIVAYGIPFVAAAGNNSEEDLYLYPGAADSAITVAATNINDELADFSNYGSKIDILAPGAGIYSSVPPEISNDGFLESNGTSMAAPFVTGAIALYLQKNPYATPTEVKEFLANTSSKDQISGLGGKNTTNQLLHVPTLSKPTNIDVNPIWWWNPITQSSYLLFASVSWTDTSNVEDAYVIEGRRGVGTQWEELGRLPANSTSFSDFGAVENTFNSYRIRAYVYTNGTSTGYSYDSYNYFSQ
ncbi:S8 family peptidase [Puniceicoccaceae bacterium K14]|nr:S8 family peptidase [Puniceicoccaceae bacterium K14]